MQMSHRDRSELEVFNRRHTRNIADILGTYIYIYIYYIATDRDNGKPRAGIIYSYTYIYIMTSHHTHALVEVHNPSAEPRRIGLGVRESRSPCPGIFGLCSAVASSGSTWRIEFERERGSLL